jgi:hypothetical protein
MCGTRSTAYQLRWRAHPAQKFFNDLAFEFNSKTPSVLHGKFLSPS